MSVDDNKEAVERARIDHLSASGQYIEALEACIALNIKDALFNAMTAGKDETHTDK